MAWDTTIGGTRIINDGSVGYPLDGDPRGAWVAIEVDSGALTSVSLQRFDFDHEESIRRLEASGEPFTDMVIRRLQTAQP